MALLKKYGLPLFFASWLLVNLWQAGVTELFDDEAYYWLYSKFLDWGYFDHPPMIGLLIRAGYALFPSEFGLRLFIVLMSTATLGIIYSLLPRKNDSLFYCIAASMALLQIGGIIAVPDIPLAFFTAVFFWLYRRLLKRSSAVNGLLLGLGMALMLYSKYHGLLVIVFTLLSNPRLLRLPAAWLAAGLGALLFAPHLYWQWLHDFPSVRYHLLERNAPGYRISFSLEYLGGQLLLAGPLLGWLLIWKAAAHRPADLLERALKFTLLGFYLFFLLSSLKGRVEANWTIPAFVPLFILAHQALLDQVAWKKVLRYSLPLTLLLVLAVRVYMALDIPARPGIPKDEFHQNRAWAAAIRARTAGRPVVFLSSYQQASKYWFYSGIPSLSLNAPDYRRNNFNFWPVEDSLRGRDIYFVAGWNPVDFTDSLPTPRGLLGEKLIKDFYSSGRIGISTTEKQLLADSGRLQPLALKISGAPPDSLVGGRIFIYIYQNGEVLAHYPAGISRREGALVLGCPKNINLPKGKYQLRFALPSSLPGFPTMNSSPYPLLLK